MRREGGIKTYGRHRSRVIVSDIWLSDSGGKNIFGSSSENDSSKQSVFHISSSSSGHTSPSLNSSDNFTDPSYGRDNRKRLARQKKNAVKENIDLTKKKPVPSTKSITKRGKASNSYLFKDSSEDASHSFSNKSERIPLSESGNTSSRVLRSRCETSTGNATGNFKKQVPSTAAKRKRHVRKTNAKPSAKELSVNFSDFDDYSLVIQETSTGAKNDKGCVETSTPLAKRTRKMPCNLIKNANISHIEVVVSPSSDTCYTSLETPYSLQDNYSNITDDLHSSPALGHQTNKARINTKSKTVPGHTNTEHRTPECVVLLKKWTDSFLEKYTHSGSAGKKDLNNSEEVNGSMSLFSTPGDSVGDDIRFLTSKISRLSYIEHSSEEEEEEFSDYEYEEVEEEEEEEEEEYDDDEIEDRLDVLRETDENSTENEEEEEDDLKDQSEPLLSHRMTRHTRNLVNKAAQHSNDDVEDINDDEEDEAEEVSFVSSDDDEDVSDESQDVFKLNLRKLNQSLQNNQISLRNRICPRKKSTESDSQDESSNTSGMERSVSGTLYMINEKYKEDVDGKFNCSEELFSDSSRYETARSMDIRNSHVQRADGDSDGNLSDRNDNNPVQNDDDSDSNLSDRNDNNSVQNDDDSDSNLSVRNDNNSVQNDDDSDDNNSDSNEENSDDANSDSNNGASNNDGDELYYSAKEISSRDSLDKEMSSPARRKFSFKDRYEKLKNSFSEMLTPKKKKGSLVPIPARSKVMVLCDQTDPISWIQALTRPVLTKCKKIGEGVYGEVFRSSSNKQSVAIKIIPIEGDFLVNDEPQKKFEEILPEIVIAKELSDLRFSSTCFTSSFCEVKSVSCVRGKYPAGLLKQWDVYDKAKRSENDRPDVFNDDQLYIVFEFADCGTALESYKPDNLQQSKSILSQVTFALAVAEEALQFEHRDLHWGNVLIRPTDEEEMVFQLTGQEFRVPTMGIEANVIDYTLSRLTKDGCKVYSDLSKDDALFQGKGDYQFDIYRNMKEANGNDWEKFCPFTNVLWLHYLADKLVYRNNTSLNNREERDMLRQFRQFLSQMLNFGSSIEMAADALFLNS